MPSPKRVLGWTAALAILAGVSIWAAYYSPDHRPETVNLNFTLKDMNGRDVRLSDFAGKPLLVNFWATWCVPCLVETPQLVALASEYQEEGLVVIGISYDDTAEQIRPFAENFKVNYPLLVGKDRDDVFDAFRLGAGLPTTVIVKPDGTVAARLKGLNTKLWFQSQLEPLF